MMIALILSFSNMLALFLSCYVDVCQLWSLSILLCATKESKRFLWPSCRPTHRGNYALQETAGSIWDISHCHAKGCTPDIQEATAEHPMSHGWESKEKIIQLKMGLVLHAQIAAALQLSFRHSRQLPMMSLCSALHTCLPSVLLHSLHQQLGQSPPRVIVLIQSVLTPSLVLPESCYTVNLLPSPFCFLVE